MIWGTAMYGLLIIACAALLTALDQVTKLLAEQYLKGNPPIVIWDGVFELSYATNTGAAFGILEGRRFLLIAVPLIVLAGLYYIMVKGKFGRSWLLTTSGTLIIAGGIGNLIDRIFRRQVIDFFYFKLIDFPVFNVADCFVVVGSFLLLFYFVFVYKEEKHGHEPQADMASEPAQREEDVTVGEPDTDSDSGEYRGEA